MIIKNLSSDFYVRKNIPFEKMCKQKENLVVYFNEIARYINLDEICLLQLDSFN